MLGRGRSPLLLVLLAAALPVSAQDPKENRETRQAQMVRYKEFSEIIEEIAQEVGKADRAHVVWLIDNAPTLKTTQHGELLARHVAKYFKGLKTTHAVMAFGEKPSLVLKSTEDVGAVATAIRALADFMPDDKLKNCLLNVREAAKLAASASGPSRKFVVLYTQENGDNEDDLEATLLLLKRQGVTLLPVAPEAIYSDPFWDSFMTGTSRFGRDLDPEQYRRLPFQLRGPDCAFLEFPYGWPYVWYDPSYIVPSGFGYYGLDRLATHTGGKYFMYNAERGSGTFCEGYPTHGCHTCAGRHMACGASFDMTKLLVTAPDVGSRAEVLGHYSSEPLFLAIQASWERLAREGILRGSPQLDVRGASLVENKSNRGSRNRSVRTGNWDTIRRDALRDADEVARLSAELQEAEKQLETKADRRALATMDALLVHYRMLVQTFKQLAAFCEEGERITKLKRPSPPGFATSQLDDYIGKPVDGFTWYNLYLCHGGEAMKSVKLLGDLKELHATLDFADKMIDKHRGTPWEVLMRRAYLPVFSLRLSPGSLTRPRVESSGQNTATTRPARPKRGAVDNGAGAGVTTGK